MTASPLVLVRISDLSSAQDPGWLVRDLWPRAALGFIAGPGASGETELAIDLCVSVASGLDCLDHFQTLEQGPVIACFATDPAPTLRQRVQTLCAHRRLDLEKLDLHLIDPQHLRIDLATDQARIEKVIASYKPKLLVLDPLSAVHRLNENCAAQIGPPLAWLQRLSVDHQLAIAIVHHTIKRRARHLGHALRGSSVLCSSAKTFAFLEPSDGQFLLTLEHRALAARPPLRLQLVREHQGSRLRPVFDPLGPSDVRVLLEDRVLDAVRQAQAPLSRVALRARLGVNNARLGDALLSLEREGRLLRSDSGWILCEPEPGIRFCFRGLSMNPTGAPSCGLWPTRRGLVGAVVDADGVLVFAGRLPTDLDERDGWLFHVERFYGTSPELVLTEPVARHNPIGRISAECGFTVWVAPLHLVTPLARAAFWRPAPRQLAALLARLPRVASLRASLRPVPRDPGPTQLRFAFPHPTSRF